MELLALPDEPTVDEVAALLIAAVIRARPDAAVVAATGNTPIGAYRRLAALRRRGALDTGALRVFQLDAYLGLGPDDPRSLERWTRTAVLGPLGVPPERFTPLPGAAPDPDRACRDYHRAVVAVGGYHLAVLGLGPNGHLGFNEPPSPADAPTRVVTLSPASVRSNAAYWGGEERVPRRALTAGLDLLLASRQIVLIVKGAHKRAVLDATLRGPVGAEVPASWLRTHPAATVLADPSALGRHLDKSRRG